MIKKSIFYIWVFLIILTIPLLFKSTFADVPDIIEIKEEIVGKDTIIYLKIEHSSPSSYHYVDIVEIEIDDKIQRINLAPQTQTIFEYKANLGQVDQKAKLRVRVNCNLHGWSRWATIQIAPTTLPTTTTDLTTTTTETPTAMPLGTINMIIQIALILTILFGVLLAIKKKFRQHHNLLVILTIVNGISILVVMIPTTPAIIAQAFYKLNTVIILSILHAIIGAFTMTLVIAVMIKKTMVRKKWMRILLISWITSFVLGTLIYSIIY